MSAQHCTKCGYLVADVGQTLCLACDPRNVRTVGGKVRFTAKFLRDTGQVSGREPHSKWIVQACDCSLCALGRHVCTNERRDPAELASGYTPAELAAHPSLQWRHLACGNLERVK